MKEMDGEKSFWEPALDANSGTQWDTEIDGLLVIFIYLSIKQNLPCKHVYSGILFGGVCLSVRVHVGSNCPVNQRSFDPPASHHLLRPRWWLRKCEAPPRCLLSDCASLSFHVFPLSPLYSFLCISPGLLWAERKPSAGNPTHASISFSVHHHRAGRLGPSICV